LASISFSARTSLRAAASISAAIWSSKLLGGQSLAVTGFRIGAGIGQPIADGLLRHPDPLGDL
jgi:hypothetical protein